MAPSVSAQVVAANPVFFKWSEDPEAEAAPAHRGLPRVHQGEITEAPNVASCS